MASEIKFVDLRHQHEAVRDEIETEIKKLIDQSRFIGGPPVEKFESEFAEYLGVSNVIGCANGTDALWLALEAAEIGPGDAVITQPNTFIATVEAITRTGAIPLFVDIDLELATIDVAMLQNFLETECDVEDDGRVSHRKTSTRVAAIMPVHLYGLPAEMRSIMEIADAFGLKVIEDAAQAQGAAYLDDGKWKKTGSFGYAAGFSFYPGKNLGAMGDAGAVATNDDALAEKMLWLRDHGSSQKYVHPTPHGWNSRLDSIQAVVLSAKLKKLDEWNNSRRQAASFYKEALKDLPIALPIQPDYAHHIYHLYVIRHEQRELIQKELNHKNIQSGLHYPIPLHLQKAYRHLNIPKGSFPNAEQSAETLLSLPMHQALTNEDVERVRSVLQDIIYE